MADGVLGAPGFAFRCAIGWGGVVPAAAKREGDGATPAGDWPVRGLLVRTDRLAPPVARLPWRALRPADGWSDDARDPAYNRPVAHPHPWSAEHLWRDDGLYDLIVVLGHNDGPPVPGRGSAIFLHCAAPDYTPTHGCVALARADLLALLPELGPHSVLGVVG